VSEQFLNGTSARHVLVHSDTGKWICISTRNG